MKTLLVPWWLLLLGVSLTSGHYIRHAEDSHSNVYEVQEGSSGVSFINPKPDKPTLREILYYHVIERARDGKPITERSFTNGHGYQFLESDSHLSNEKQENGDVPYENEHNENKELNESEQNKEPNEDGEHDDDGHYEPEQQDDNEGQYNEENEHAYDDAEALLKQLLADYNEDEEDPESTTTQKPLTDEDVKEAYKSRSYLFDQMRQRYSVKRMAVPETLHRRKRQADEEPIPDAPKSPSDISLKEAYMQPKTYGMNLNPEGGYVWNNLNKPPTYFELGTSNGNPNEGQYESQSQENIPQPTEPVYAPAPSQYIPPAIENAYVAPPGTSDSGSSEDIYVSTNRPSAMPLEPEQDPESSELINENPEPMANPEPINDNPEPNDSAAYPVAPVIADGNDKESNEGVANYPMGPEVYNPEPSNPEQPVIGNPEPVQSEPEESALPQENQSEPAAPIESYENPGPNYESSQPEEPKLQSSPEKEAETIKDMPEAPTLPPLNFDNLPSYIRDAISSTEQPASIEQTENPYFNPQPNPEDKKVMEDKMEDIFATITPVEDIPKTYGMNLTSEGGHVWNDMVNPPVSYDIGPSNKPEEEHKEEPTQKPEVNEPEILPEEEPAKPEKEGEIAEPVPNPNEPIPELPEPHESGEVKEPIEEPAEPEKEGETEEPIPELPTPEQPEPLESVEAKEPIEVPAEPENEGEIAEPVPNPKEPILEQPEPLESEEVKEPIEEPAEPEKEGEIEEPIADPNQPVPVDEPKPEIPENEDDKPVEPNQPEPIEPVPENPEPEHPEIEETKKPDDNEEPIQENEQEEPTELKPEDEKKPDIMSELLKSEQFWKWLGEWTATYMELLEKHIRKIAIQEICNREKSGKEMCLLDEKPEDDETGVIVKDGKVIVDGKEIDLTHNDNLDKDLKKGHNNQWQNKDNGNKIQATTIYGNSVGNEHVTNVFIFTDDKAEVDDKLKPDNDKLKPDNDKLKPENDKLKPDNDKLKPDNDKLKPENDKLKPENDKLKPENDKLKPENDKLKPENDKLKPENDKLKPENDKLKPENDSVVDFVIDDRVKEENKEDTENPIEEAAKETIEIGANQENKEESNKDQEDKEEVAKEDETKPEFSENTSASKEYLEK